MGFQRRYLKIVSIGLFSSWGSFGDQGFRHPHYTRPFFGLQRVNDACACVHLSMKNIFNARGRFACYNVRKLCSNVVVDLKWMIVTSNE